jgi:hypothetical protein
VNCVCRSYSAAWPNGKVLDYDFVIKRLQVLSLLWSVTNIFLAFNYFNQINYGINYVCSRVQIFWMFFDSAADVELTCILITAATASSTGKESLPTLDLRNNT